MEKKRNMDQSFDWKKKNGVASEGSALVKTSSTPAYAAGRDSLPTTTPYAPGLRAGVSSQPKPEKTEQAREPEQVREPEIPKGNETPPYVMGRDEAKPPTLPYGAGLQGGIKPQPPAQKPPNQSGGTEEEPYVMGRDEWEPPTIPYAAGLQGGVKPLPTVQKPTVPRGGTERDPYIAGRDEVKTGLPYAAGSQAGIEPGSSSKNEQSGSWRKKKAPKRAAQKVLEELGTLERSYDDMLREAEAWESQAASQKTPEEMSQWEKKSRNLRKKAAELEPYLDTLQKEWKYAMDWEWEEKKKKEGYRDLTLRDLTVGSFWQGYDTAQFGKESYRDMLGDEDNRKAEYKEKLAGEEYKFMPESFGERATSAIAGTFGREFNKWTDPAVVGTGMAAGVGAAVAGNAGPQALTPEEVITVPGAFIVGSRFGAAKTEMEIEAGLAYSELLEHGVSEEMAQIIALAVGGTNAVLDAVPFGTLLQSLSIFQKTGTSAKVMQVILDELEKRGINIAGGIGQDLLQEGITIAGVQAGTKMNTGEWAYSTDQVIDRLGDTVEDSLLTNGFSEVIGGVKDAVVDAGHGGEKGKTSWVSDETALKISEDWRSVDYLFRKGKVKITRDMSPTQKINAVRTGIANIIQDQKKLEK